MFENEKLINVEISNEMKKSYIDYAMSVIVGRALPDVRDGLKPVHRRILYTMNEDNLFPTSAYRKCATTVGDVLGRYHPHGDASVYDALVRLAQDFTMRYPMIDGQGNFGSIDGDPAAAYRYTEARMSKYAMLMLRDIEKETVDYMPNFDETRKEPVVVPSRIPSLLINGSSGIAVGMATNIPPHNLNEVIDGCIAAIDNPDIDIDGLMEYIKGPDFPTAGLIMGRAGIIQAYNTGKGKVIMRAKAEIDTDKEGRERIIVTELPYQVNKSLLIQRIAELVKDKRIEGIYDLRDESDKEGIRIVIEIKRDANANIVLNNLYKFSSMQESFGIIFLALVDGQPKILNLKQIIDNYIKFQEEVIVRRTKFDLEKAEARAHILDGLKIALDNIDEIIKIIRSSYNDAKEKLMERFGFSEIQAQSILDMRLARLQGLEKEKIENELKDLKEKIEYYKKILNDESLVLQIIKEELTEIKEKFGDERRTAITMNTDDIEDEDLIEEENNVVTLTHFGYIKRLSTSVYRSQHRGGRGVSGLSTRNEDYVEKIFTTSTHNYILFFTNRGRMYKMKAYQIPESGRTAKGLAIVNLLPLEPEEKITAMIPLREFSEENNLCMITKKGIIKKTNLDEYNSHRKGGLIAIGLREDDELIHVEITNGEDNIIIATHDGQCIRFREKDARCMGRNATGVRGILLNDGDYVIGACVEKDDHTLLSITENGYGKKSDISEFKLQTRGGKGVMGYRITEKTGKVAGVSIAKEDDDVMMITSEGIIIRCDVAEISKFGRATQGVRVMKLEDGISIVSTTIAEKEEDEETEVNDEASTEENLNDETNTEALDTPTEE
ncbi:MAG: DNA gyrase subunit A [Ruminococcaceae bacterium]|nr:DNA gyrase subunit A [Oscillospiraceae bacterium]